MRFDGTEIFFESPRTGPSRIYTSVGGRTELDGLFSFSMRLAELATPASEDPNWVSPDECVIYFARGGVGARKILRARRPL